MVVAIVHPTQLRHAIDAMLAVVSDEHVPHVMTVNLMHGVKKTDFPRHSLLVLVHFWGDLAASTSGAFDGSSTVSGAAIGSLPNDLTIDTSFLKHGLTDVIHLPRVNFWRQRVVQTAGVPFASSSTSAMPPLVDDMQRPLELYLYFLVGFKFPSSINPGHGYVFDLTFYAASVHPAGATIITNHCGTDATAAYSKFHQQGLSKQKSYDGVVRLLDLLKKQPFVLLELSIFLSQ